MRKKFYYKFGYGENSIILKENEIKIITNVLSELLNVAKDNKGSLKEEYQLSIVTLTDEEYDKIGEHSLKTKKF